MGVLVSLITRCSLQVLEINITTDADTTVSVMHGEGSMNSDEEEDEGLKYDDEDADESQSIPTPDSMVSPESGHHHHGLSTTQQSDYSLPMHNRYVAMEEPRYQESGMHNAQMQQQPFATSGYQASGIQEQDPNRRSGWSPNFSSTPNPYNTWTSSQNNTVPTTSIPFTTFNPTHGPPNPPHFNLPPPGPTQMHQYVPPQFHDRLRTGSIGHPHQLPQQHSFQDFLHDNNFNQGNVDPGLKQDHHSLSQH